jgi:hypothetical protein
MDDPAGRPDGGNVGVVSHPAAAGRHHHTRPPGKLLRQLALQPAECRLAKFREDLADGHALTPLDFTIEVDEPGTKRVRQQGTHRALARSGQSDEHDMRPSASAGCVHPPMRWSIRAR